MKRGVALVELVIIAAILGILAAIVVPQFWDHSKLARQTVAKDNLRTLRAAIELYAAQHAGVPPGYPDDDPQASPDSSQFVRQLTESGRYLKQMPRNPFNRLTTVRMIPNGQTFPSDPTGRFGWVYQPATMTIRLDWPGYDTEGIRYYDY